MKQHIDTDAQNRTDSVSSFIIRILYGNCSEMTKKKIKQQQRTKLTQPWHFIPYI